MQLIFYYFHNAQFDLLYKFILESSIEQDLLADIIGSNYVRELIDLWFCDIVLKLVFILYSDLKNGNILQKMEAFEYVRDHFFDGIFKIKKNSNQIKGVSQKTFIENGDTNMNQIFFGIFYRKRRLYCKYIKLDKSFFLETIWSYSDSSYRVMVSVVTYINVQPSCPQKYSE